MRRLPPLAQLRAFEAVARNLSFKKAAAELAVTPTAISHQIQLLENFCGQSLFRRRPRPVTLSKAGERLYPVLREGLDAFEAAIAGVTSEDREQSLVVTTTNAFASRWIVPRLPRWRSSYPGIALEVVGTDRVLDLAAGEADVAIRYMYQAPAELGAVELFRDKFFPVCSPRLLPDGQPITRLEELHGYTLIHCYWSPSDPHAPTWSRWLDKASTVASPLPKLSEMDQLSFQEELHAIDAAVAGQGIIIVSDVLIARALEEGTLAKAVDIALPGYGFYLVHEADHPRQPIIELFSSWALAVR